MSEKAIIKRQLTGTVVSTKMQKTIVVRVDRTAIHPKYGKRFKTSKRYKVHDERGEYRDGEVVVIEQCRPMSAGKRWRVVEKTVSAENKN